MVWFSPDGAVLQGEGEGERLDPLRVSDGGRVGFVRLAPAFGPDDPVRPGQGQQIAEVGGVQDERGDEAGGRAVGPDGVDGGDECPVPFHAHDGRIERDRDGGELGQHGLKDLHPDRRLDREPFVDPAPARVEEGHRCPRRRGYRSAGSVRGPACGSPGTRPCCRPSPPTGSRPVCRRPGTSSARRSTPPARPGRRSRRTRPPAGRPQRRPGWAPTTKDFTKYVRHDYPFKTDKSF